MTLVRLIFLALLPVAACEAQTSQQPQAPPQPATQEQQQPEPPITQVRKSVVFIQLKCRKGDKEYDVRGTGFFVGFPEPRLGKDLQFVYLVTNRHVALCWDDSGAPMIVESISIRLNRRNGAGDDTAVDLPLSPGGNVPWFLPADDAIDLALLPAVPDQNTYDFKIVPSSIFAGKDVLKENRITEGEPVFFAGFFYQFPGVTRMEPIVRQGIIAMMPHDRIPFVNARENLYLADLHVFGGNSGSPAFIDLGGFHEGSVRLGLDYRLLGVVNGELTEDQNFNLELSTTLTGTQRVNSGISTIVPADDLKALLEDPRLQALRDSAVARQQPKK